MEKTSNVTVALEHSLLRCLALGTNMMLTPEDVANVDWNNAMFHPAVRDAMSNLVLSAITEGVTNRRPGDPMGDPVTALADAVAAAAIFHSSKA